VDAIVTGDPAEVSRLLAASPKLSTASFGSAEAKAQQQEILQLLKTASQPH
jgi:hypothetical protein